MLQNSTKQMLRQSGALPSFKEWTNLSGNGGEARGSFAGNHSVSQESEEQSEPSSPSERTALASDHFAVEMDHLGRDGTSVHRFVSPSNQHHHARNDTSAFVMSPVSPSSEMHHGGQDHDTISISPQGRNSSTTHESFTRPVTPYSSSLSSAPPPYPGSVFENDRAAPRVEFKKQGHQGNVVARTCHPQRWNFLSWNVMYLFFVIGMACAGAHHAFYNLLDGRPADDQLQMLRYGTLLAFGAKAGFAATVVAAYRQRVWTTVRKRLMTIGALDSLFAATEDPWALWNWEMIKSAKVAVLLAAFVWLAPVVVILTSNTLLVELRMIRTNDMCSGVRTLNFTFEGTYDWREPIKIDNFYARSVSVWNTTKSPNIADKDYFDYYTGPSPAFVQTATIGAFMDEAVMRKNANVDICGSGWNCSYEITFVAPGYECTELARGVASKAGKLEQSSGTISPPIDTDMLVPTGSYSYLVHATGGGYSPVQMKDVAPGGWLPNITNSSEYPSHLGALRTEPVLWVSYAEITDPTKPIPKKSDPEWNTSFTPVLAACEHLEASYRVRFTYTDSLQTTEVLNRTFIRPIINTTYVPNLDAKDGTEDNTTATPVENYIVPANGSLYRLTAAYHSMGHMLRYFVNGTVEIEGDLVNPIANTNAIQTGSRLLDTGNNWFAHANLTSRIQTFYEDMILSILSNPQFAAVVWAADTGVQSGMAAPSSLSLRYPCERWRTANVYKYNSRDLWIVYGIAVLLTVVGVTTGVWAIHENGGASRDTRFSSIVAASRGPALDRVRFAGGGGDGGGGGTSGSRKHGVHHACKVSRDVMGLKVGYGVLKLRRQNSQGGGGHGVIAAPRTSTATRSTFTSTADTLTGGFSRHLPFGDMSYGASEARLLGDEERAADTTTPTPTPTKHDHETTVAEEMVGEQQHVGKMRYGFGLEGDVHTLKRKGSVVKLSLMA